MRQCRGRTERRGLRRHALAAAMAALSVLWAGAAPACEGLPAAGANGDIVLSPGRTYTLMKPCAIDGTVHTLPGDTRATIVAGAAFTPMIEMLSGSAVRNVTLSGRYRVAQIIRIRNGSDRIRIEDSHIGQAFDGTLAEAFSANPKLAGIYAKGAATSVGWDPVEDIRITGNTIEEIGFNAATGGIANADRWRGPGDGIYLYGVAKARISGNRISNVSAAGIRFPGSRQVYVGGNYITATGRNALFYRDTRNIVADGITAYKNRLDPALAGFLGSGRPEDYIIENNIVRDSLNNGIHVSGTDLVVRHNRIEDFRYRGLYLGADAAGDGIDPLTDIRVYGNDIRNRVRQPDDARDQAIYCGGFSALLDNVQIRDNRRQGADAFSCHGLAVD